MLEIIVISIYGKDMKVVEFTNKNFILFKVVLYLEMHMYNVRL